MGGIKGKEGLFGIPGEGLWVFCKKGQEGSEMVVWTSWAICGLSLPYWTLGGGCYLMDREGLKGCNGGTSLKR